MLSGIALEFKKANGERKTGGLQVYSKRTRALECL